MKKIAIDIRTIIESLGSLKLKSAKGYMASHPYVSYHDKQPLGDSMYPVKDDNTKEKEDKKRVKISKAFKIKKFNQLREID